MCRVRVEPWSSLGGGLCGALGVSESDISGLGLLHFLSAFRGTALFGS